MYITSIEVSETMTVVSNWDSFTNRVISTIIYGQCNVTLRLVITVVSIEFSPLGSIDQ